MSTAASDRAAVSDQVTASDRVGEVLTRLDRVHDPELDEPVTGLGFVAGVAVDDDGRVRIGFRLPTYWCAANFAFLMADDMRREVGRLPWVRGVSVVLGEHMYADTINAAMAHGHSFQEAFASEADGDLAALRRVFDLKAFQRRQMALLDHLLEAGHAPAALATLTLAELRPLAGDAGAPLVDRYLERRGVPGPDGPDDPAFVDENGHAVSVAEFPAHRRVLRRVAVNVEFNGALCRGLLAARFNEREGEPQGEPSLLDFVHGRVTEGVRPTDGATALP